MRAGVRTRVLYFVVQGVKTRCVPPWNRDGPLDMFRLFKSVQSRGGHERVTQEQGWAELAAELGFPRMGNDLHEAYLRYLSDFEVGRSFDHLVEGKSSLPIAINRGTSLWNVRALLWHGFVRAVKELGRRLKRAPPPPPLFKLEWKKWCLFRVLMFCGP